MRFRMMLRRLVVVLLLTALLGCAAAPRRVTNFFIDEDLARLRRNTVAVLPFDNLSGFIGADFLVTDEFNLQLGRTGYFDLVERVRVAELYKEQDLDPHRIDQTTAVRVGKMLGAHAVVLGTVTSYEPSEIVPTVPSDAYPIIVPVPTDMDGRTATRVAVAGAVLTLILMAAAHKYQDARVGITARLVGTEAGQQFWQARETFVGDDPGVVALADNRYDKKRVNKDVEFLSRLLCTAMCRTFSDAGAMVGGDG